MQHLRFYYTNAPCVIRRVKRHGQAKAVLGMLCHRQTCRMAFAHLSSEADEGIEVDEKIADGGQGDGAHDG
ncbi:MAG TPA: hypothetical protein VGC91_11770 [Pyrinomonadaceae bacterium]|jgi:hypothetical protein